MCLYLWDREGGRNGREGEEIWMGGAEDNNQCHLQEFHLSPVWRQGFTLASKLQRSTSTEIHSIYHWLEFVCDFWGWNLQLEGMGFNYLAISNESWKKTSLSYQFSSEMVIYKAPNMMHSGDPVKGQSEWGIQLCLIFPFLLFALRLLISVNSFIHSFIQ